MEILVCSVAIQIAKYALSQLALNVNQVSIFTQEDVLLANPNTEIVSSVIKLNVFCVKQDIIFHQECVKNVLILTVKFVMAPYLLSVFTVIQVSFYLQAVVMHALLQSMDVKCVLLMLFVILVIKDIFS